MRTMNKVCAFTGHRPNKLPWRYNETDSRCVALKTVLAEQITALAETGFTQFLSGMAEATDTWSANYARKMGREIIVIDPITCLISHGESAPSPA